MLLTGMSKTRVKRQLMSDYLLYAKKATLATEVALHEQKIIGTPSPSDCSIYVSIPFCPTRCQYCSFVCYTSNKLLSLIPDYVERLVKDIKDIFATIDRNHLNVKTVYIGGGTPTILEPEQLRILLDAIATGLAGRNIEEFTCESGRPDTITREKLQVIKEYGVGRISVNPQTLCDEVLQGIGRSHSVDDFYRAYNIAKEVGIEAINTDLIAGLPGDTFPRFSASMDAILALSPENITVHTFCVKRSAAFRQTSNIYSLRGGDAGKCVDYSQIKSRQAGYIPYYMYRQKNTVGNFENVGFSKEGYEGRYNIYMMEEVHSILAAGAGAVTKLVSIDSAGNKKPTIKRIFNPKYPYEYLDNGESTKMIEGVDAFFADNPIYN
jgi:oxygen-independent coproporphyrinogen-3 oxidase